MQKSKYKKVAIFAVSTILIIFIYALIFNRNIFKRVYYYLNGSKTVAELAIEIEAKVKPKIQENFRLNEITYPPANLAIIVLKTEKIVELWTMEEGQNRFICSYPILAASGVAGPKLMEGDKQVPEGFYKIVSVNPNSLYHISMLLDYPNEFDRKIANQESRTNLGGEICIHGKASSVGCVAVGDSAIEEIFYLAHTAGLKNVTVIIAPYDFRKNPPKENPVPQNPSIENPHSKSWLTDLYKMIEKILENYR